MIELVKINNIKFIKVNLIIYQFTDLIWKKI